MNDTDSNFLGMDDPRREADRVFAFAVGVAATYVHAALGTPVPFPGMPLVQGALGGFVAVFIWRWLWE